MSITTKTFILLKSNKNSLINQNVSKSKLVSTTASSKGSKNCSSSSSKNQKIDSSIELPKVRNIYEYDASYYEQYANKKYYQSLSELNNSIQNNESSNNKKITDSCCN